MIILQVIKHGLLIFVLIVSETCNHEAVSHAQTAAFEMVDAPANITGSY